MDSANDYYAVLEITHTESLDGIQKAFRRLAKQYHPDRAGAQAVERFRAILEAYQVLSDPQQRQLYDEALGRPRTCVAPEPLLRAQPNQSRPEPLRPEGPVWGMFRKDVREFGRIAEVLLLSPILLSSELTADEQDFIRLYLSELVERYGLD